ncbi:MerR family transcriptional regulator [Streptomyces radicis]|uniref:MerR family transcriptional regulator n=1 Tax=Streptomyces radicis TaxID=1750517 RepID=A0A3A9WC05_9ACTN|nr:MerR family transcriptional regulator [Streptomyces radicis]RKN10891.1 MerR family transcriptional regulator [Streptomyces radicis]RKN25155.1 MerR family transcriptional regulator [Streptomyces radicis]
MSAMRISQLTERTGVPATTLRFYETAGLLPADRTASGYRRYGEDAVERLTFIGAAKHLGLALDEIAELLAVWESGACREVKADLRPRIAARLTAADERAAELAAFTTTLRAALAHLDALPDRTGRCDPRCGFLAAAPSSAGSTAPRPGPVEAERWRSAPVACSLSAEEAVERVTAWHRILNGARRREIPEGLRLTLPSARAAAVAELAAAEQHCCAFLDFRLHLEGPDLHLEVRAPAEGAGLLAELFAEAA